MADYDLNKVLFHIQGEYILWQCSQHCHAQTYRDDDAIREMVAKQEDMKIPYELIPHCPKCDAPMEINKQAQVGMVEDADFHALQRMTRHNPNAVFMTLNKKAYRISFWTKIYYFHIIANLK